MDNKEKTVSATAIRKDTRVRMFNTTAIRLPSNKITFLTEKNEKISFKLNSKIHSLIPIREKGFLTYKGFSFIKFKWKDGSVNYLGKDEDINE